MMFHRLVTALIFVCLFSIAGCSANNGPVAPDDTPQARYIINALDGFAPGESVIFDASTSTGGLSKIVSYIWDWGDGSDPENYDVPTTAHTFIDADHYTVSLTIRTQLGKSAISSQAVEIATPDDAPVAVFNYDDPAGWNPGSIFYFDGSESYCPYDDIVSYFWDFGDGETFGPSDSPEAVYTFENEGEFSVKLTVEDSSGRTGVSEVLELLIGVPDNPEIIWSSPDLGCPKVIIEDSLAYLLGSGSLKIFDINNPEMPEQIGQAYVRGTDSQLRDGYLYVTEFSDEFYDLVNGFLVFDVTDPSKPHIVKSFSIGSAYCFDITKDYAYVGGQFVSDNKIHVFQVDDERTEYVGTSDKDIGLIGCIEAVGDYIYCGMDDRYIGPTIYEVFVLDTSDPTIPVYVDKFPVGGHPQDFIKHNNDLHILVENEEDGAFYEIYDTSNPVAPTLISSTLLDPDYREVKNIELSGRHLYVANYNSDLTIYSLGENGTLNFFSHTELPRKAVTIEVSGNLAVVGANSINRHNQELIILRLW